MPDEEPIIDDAVAHDTAVQARETPAYEPFEEDEWAEELPRRPRRRLLGAGGNPIALALLGVLLIACGFIGGVLVEKGQSTSSSSAGAGTAGLASRFAALRGISAGGTSGASTGAAATGGASAAGGGSFGGSAGAGGTGASAGVTTGSVAYISGNTLYVTNSEGNTVKVTTSAASTVTKTVKAEVKGIHPGETVVVTGTTGAKGVLSAESIRVGTSGGGGGLGALFGGSGSGAGGGASKASSGAGSGEPALFGKGG
jgi:hypothetical protein